MAATRYLWSSHLRSFISFITLNQIDISRGVDIHHLSDYSVHLKESTLCAKSISNYYCSITGTLRLYSLLRAEESQVEKFRELLKANLKLAGPSQQARPITEGTVRPALRNPLQYFLLSFWSILGWRSHEFELIGSEDVVPVEILYGEGPPPFPGRKMSLRILIPPNKRGVNHSHLILHCKCCLWRYETSPDKGENR
jgi:hypothetical protein